MTKKQILISTILIITLSFSSWGIWLYEIIESIGWYTLEWLSTTLYSPYIISLLVSIAYIFPFVFSIQLSFKQSLLSLFIFYFANLLCYFAGKSICYEMYSLGWIAESLQIKILLLLLLKGIGVYIAIGFIYRFTTNRLLKKIKNSTAFTITAISFCAIPLSMLTVYIFGGFGNGNDWVDAVKMGYPVFWTTLLIGLCGIIITRRKI